MEISIIMPVYNAAPYLAECIESVVRQTMEDKELICIDDGSVDESWKILQEYARKYSWIHIYRQDNKGSGPARNAGISKAEGRYIAFLDADDWYMDEFALSKLVGAADETGCKVAAGYMQVYENNQFVVRPFLRDLGLKAYGRTVINFYDYQNDFFYVQYIISRELLASRGILFPDLRRYQDPPFLLQVLIAAEQVCVCAVEFYCNRIGHQDFYQIGRRIDDILSGVLLTMQLAKENKCYMLQHRIIDRLNNDFFWFIRKNFTLSILEKLLEIDKLKIVDEIIKALPDVDGVFREVDALGQYIYLKQREWTVAGALREQHVNRVVVYGLGNFGDIFYREVEHSQLEIVAVADKNKTGVWNGMNIMHPDDVFPDCDAIIITPLQDEQIIADFRELGQDKFISFRRFIESEYGAMKMSEHMVDLRRGLVVQIALYLDSYQIKHSIRPEAMTDGKSSKLLLGDAWIELMNFLTRRIPQRERIIHKAKDFESTLLNLPQEVKPKLEMIIDHLAKGEDVNSHLTTQIFDSNKFDNLLNQWNIKHLHISDDVAVDKAAMRGNRSGYLLFAIVKPDDAYLLEVVPHPRGAGFTSYHFLEILHDNDWMELAGFQIMQGVKDIQPHITNDEDIYNFYKLHINIAFCFKEKCYASMGVTSHGNKLCHSMQIGKVEKTLQSLPGDAKFIGCQEIKDGLGFIYESQGKNHMLLVNSN